MLLFVSDRFVESWKYFPIESQFVFNFNAGWLAVQQISEAVAFHKRLRLAVLLDSGRKNLFPSILMSSEAVVSVKN